MKCLYCGGEILAVEERQDGWHKACIKDFFGTETMPEIDLSEETLVEIAKENVKGGLTVPGVQKKLSLHLTEGETPRLTLVNYPTGFILKPQTREYEALPESEFLIMQMAKETGIETVPFGLVKVPSRDRSLAYITKRIDRDGERKLAMEDFCQLDERLTIDKYKGSYERCAKIIKKYSMAPGLDMTEMFLRLVFSFMVGNSDMHLKNFSLIETKGKNGGYKLSQAYDLLPVNVVLPEDEEEMALTMNGKKNKLTRKDFMIFAESCEVFERTAEKIIDKVLIKENKYLEMVEEAILPEEMKTRLAELIRTRAKRLKA